MVAVLGTLLRGFAVILALLTLAGAAAAAQPDLPRDKGLPVIVNAGLAFVDVSEFDENKGTFTATVDLRVGWTDTRLAKPGAANMPPETLRDSIAEQRMQEMWVPPVVLGNQDGKPSFSAYGLRIFSDGRVEMLRRVTASFSIGVDVSRFPFDRQQLAVDIAVRGLTTAQVVLRFDQSDIDFSKPSHSVDLPGWSIGLVDLRSVPVLGWYNASEDRVIAALAVAREPGLVVASIFIPLFASLLIPLLAIWLNRMEDGVLQIDTFELVNIIIGGLFTVIALNFTVYSSYEVLASSDNTVNRLFALNYLGLATALIVNIVFSRFEVFSRMFGRYVQEQAYFALMFVVPFLLFTIAISMMVAAYV